MGPDSSFLSLTPSFSLQSPWPASSSPSVPLPGLPGCESHSRRRGPGSWPFAPCAGWGLGERGGARAGTGTRRGWPGAPGDCECVRRFVRCRNATAEVRMRTFLSPCVDDCGPYGQCKLLRTHNYLYAACECKAGEWAAVDWRWTCGPVGRRRE